MATAVARLSIETICNERKRDSSCVFSSPVVSMLFHVYIYVRVRGYILLTTIPISTRAVIGVGREEDDDEARTAEVDETLRKTTLPAGF